MKMNRDFLKLSGFLTVFFVGAVVGLFLFYNFFGVVDQSVVLEKPRVWHSVGDYNPGALASGFLFFYTYPHQDDGETVYSSNLSTVNAYEYTDSSSGEMTGETPANTAFDFVMKFRVNVTCGYNETTSAWESSLVRAYISCNFEYASDLSSVAMTIVEIVNNTNFCWYHAYVNNSNSGYQITNDETFSVSSLTADAYY